MKHLALAFAILLASPALAQADRPGAHTDDLDNTDVPAWMVWTWNLFGTDRAHDDTRAWHWTAMPMVSYSRATSILYGASGWLFQGDRRGVTTRLFAQATLENQVWLGLTFDDYGVVSGVNLHGIAEYYRYPLPFFVTGNESPANDLGKVANERAGGEFGPGFELGYHWQLRGAVSARHYDYNHENLIAAGNFAGATDGFYLTFPLRLARDTRDRLEDPSSGAWTMFALELAPSLPARPGAVESTAGDAAVFSAERAQFFALDDGRRVILALRAKGVATAGSDALPLWPFLGGPRELRGFVNERYRGRHTALVQSELRFPIWWILSGGVFIEAGRVWAPEPIAPLPSTPEPWKIPVVAWHPCAGGGVRFALPPDGTVRVRWDFAAGPGSWNTLFLFGHPY